MVLKPLPSAIDFDANIRVTSFTMTDTILHDCGMNYTSGLINHVLSSLRSRKLPWKTRLRILNTYVMSFLILTYCRETWTINGADEARLEAAETWFLRQMLRIPWTDHNTNDNVLNTAGTERHLLTTIRRRQPEFLGRIFRKSQLKNLVINGKFEGKKGRGKPTTSYFASMRNWLDPTASKNIVIQASAKKERWRDIDRQRPGRAWHLATTTISLCSSASAL